MERSPALQMARADLALATGEDPLDVVAGIGATLVVTPTRVAIVRDGANLRPRSGLRAWDHGTVDVRLETPKHGSGRIALRAAGSVVPREVASMFVSRDAWPDAERVAAAIRREGVRSRGTGPVDHQEAIRRARAAAGAHAPKP